MKKIKNFLPIEFYFLLIPSIFIFLFSYFYLKSFSINEFGINSFLKNIAESRLNVTLWVLSLFFFFILIVESAYDFIFKRDKKDEQGIIRWKQIRSIFFIVLLISFVTYSLVMCTVLLFKIADPIKTAKLGNVALSWDEAIFKTDPGIWLINHYSN